jgi:protease-4
MPNPSPGVIRRSFGAAWRALDFTRRLVFNLLFLAIAIAVLAALVSSRPAIAPRTTLVLDPEGAVVEQFSSDPAQRALSALAGDASAEVQLRDLLRVIDAAARDERIERLVLMPDDIRDMGFATARELGAALDRFRASGKEVIAVSGGLGQDQYLLAAHADRILLDPDGAVLLEGLASYRSYFKDALDALGIEVHLIKVGTFKSAAEPFVRSDASEASKEADAYWMGGLWNDYLAEVASLRKLDPAVLADDIAHLDERIAGHDGDLARLALDQRLVDQLATRNEARQALRTAGVAEGSDGFRQVDFRHYLATLGPDSLPTPGPVVAVVVAQGEIVPGEQPPGRIGGESTAQLVRAAREDEGVAAIVLRVNSPGGDAYSSELIRRELEQARAEGKPVVVSMGDVAASGGYWIAMASDEIWAEPNTITGSIGIFGLFVTVPEALAKLGIHTDGIATTPLAGALDIRRPLSPQLESILESVIRRGYAQFIGKVADARGQTPQQVDAVAQGRVWTGAQAKERGLVDQLGGLDQAIAAAATRAKLGSGYRVRYVERPMSAWERFALDFSDSQAAAVLARHIGFALPAAAWPASQVRGVAGLVESLRGRRFGAFAHCFCDLR